MDKIQVKGTLWENMAEPEPNIKEIEELFCQKKVSKETKDATPSAATDAASQPLASKKSYITGDRARNI